MCLSLTRKQKIRSDRENGPTYTVEVTGSEDGWEEGFMEMEFEWVFGRRVGFQQEMDQSYSGRRKCLEQRHRREKHDPDEGLMSDPSGIQPKIWERGLCMERQIIGLVVKGLGGRGGYYHHPILQVRKLKHRENTVAKPGNGPGQPDSRSHPQALHDEPPVWALKNPSPPLAPQRCGEAFSTSQDECYSFCFWL